MAAIISEAVRLSQRVSYGNLCNVLDAAVEEHEAGRLPNAFAMYQEAIGIWLRYKWVETSGNYRTGIVEPERFLQKLNSGLHIDKFTKEHIQNAMRQPGVMTHRAVDIVAGIVGAVVLDRV
ncbi:hypothetical protein [Aeoliella sp. SH292]|uniref:hypothetical protein n=1 Tax=Aeoliella sp. SH292 TaxID=3454464 RepID=UPI003F9CAEA7